MKAIKSILFSVVLSLIYSLKHESTSIKLNQKITGSSSTQKHISFYDLQIEQNSQNMDLLIDSKTLNSISKTIYESPIVMISPVINKFIYI